MSRLRIKPVPRPWEGSSTCKVLPALKFLWTRAVYSPCLFPWKKKSFSVNCIRAKKSFSSFSNFDENRSCTHTVFFFKFEPYLDLFLVWNALGNVNRKPKIGLSIHKKNLEIQVEILKKRCSHGLDHISRKNFVNIKILIEVQRTFFVEFSLF